MPRSRLWPHRDAIAEALEAGTSQRSLARTYGVNHRTMGEFVARHVRGVARDNDRHARKMAARRSDADNRLQESMRDTLRHARDGVERADRHLEDLI